jgi:hypothetical protein
LQAGRAGGNGLTLDRDFVQGNILDQIRELKNRLETLERAAITGLGDIAIDGDIYYSGDLIGQRNNTTYTGYTFVPLLAPLTSTSWDGDSKADVGKTLLDLSSVFGAPAGIKAVLVYVSVNDADSAATDTYLILSPNNTALQGMAFSSMPVNDRPGRYSAVVPCNADGDIYYQVEASTGLDVFLEIWGYWV